MAAENLFEEIANISNPRNAMDLRAWNIKKLPKEKIIKSLKITSKEKTLKTG